MNKLRSIEQIITPPSPHMVGDGFWVHTFFPGGRTMNNERMSPFFLMDYNAKTDFHPTDKPRGVGVHPHRGFETVTIVYHGKVAHHDSAGNNGVIKEGDVQWMTAASGVLHKEYHEEEFSRKGGLLQMVQLWVNLPSKYKMTPAKYQSLENKDLMKVVLNDGKSILELIAGEYNGIQGTATTFSPVNLFNAKLIPGAKACFSFNRNFNTGILVIEGEIKINESKTATENHFVLFSHDGEEIVIEAVNKSVVLILSGEPINEPIASYGPFVMNTEAEIRQAYEDFNNGKFGYLED